MSSLIVSGISALGIMGGTGHAVGQVRDSTKNWLELIEEYGDKKVRGWAVTTFLLLVLFVLTSLLSSIQVRDLDPNDPTKKRDFEPFDYATFGTTLSIIVSLLLSQAMRRVLLPTIASKIKNFKSPKSKGPRKRGRENEKTIIDLDQRNYDSLANDRRASVDSSEFDHLITIAEHFRKRATITLFIGVVVGVIGAFLAGGQGPLGLSKANLGQGPLFCQDCYFMDFRSLGVSLAGFGIALMFIGLGLRAAMEVSIRGFNKAKRHEADLKRIKEEADRLAKEAQDDLKENDVTIDVREEARKAVIEKSPWFLRPLYRAYSYFGQ